MPLSKSPDVTPSSPPHVVWASAFAHRGLWSATVAENSGSAITAARRAGFGIEWDVRLSRDGVPMVFHDAPLRRMTGRAGLFDDQTAQRLGRMRLTGSRQAPPTLASAVGLADGASVLCEIKASEAPRALCRAVADVIRPFPNILPMSFEPDMVATLSEALPERPCGLVLHLSMVVGEAAHRVQMRAARALGARFLACHFTDLETCATYAETHGLKLASWTVRDEKTLRKVIARGASPIFEGLSAEHVHAALAKRGNPPIFGS